MLEAMVESAAWLVRLTYDFEHSLIELRETRNVTYKSFVRPGELLELEVVAKEMDRASGEFVGKGRCCGREVVKARFRLSHSKLGDENPEWAHVDQVLLAQARQQYRLLTDLVDAGAELVGQDA